MKIVVVIVEVVVVVEAVTNWSEMWLKKDTTHKGTDEMVPSWIRIFSPSPSAMDYE